MIATHSCPKGHSSIDSDFCSVCGTRIDVNMLMDSIGSVDSTGKTIGCPDCGTTHDPKDGKFCEICGHNFETGKSGEMPTNTPPPPIEIPPLHIPPIADITSSQSAQIPPPPSTNPSNLDTNINLDPDTSILSNSITWTIIVTIDPTLAAPESPPPPNQLPLNYTINPGMTPLIGRSKSRTVPPEISLDFDNAISSRHALLACQLDGQLVIRDIGSANGTQLNGIEMDAMRDYPLKSGDRLTLGHWTAINVI